MSTNREVLLRVQNRGPDSFFSFKDFADLPVQAVAKALSRLAKQKIIKRVRKGLYYYPKLTSLGLSYPKEALLVEHALKKDHSVQVFSGGTASFQNLGLTNQIPGSYTVISNQSTKQVKVGRLSIRISGRKTLYMKKATQLEIWILDSLRNIKHVPDNKPDSALEKLIVTIHENIKMLPRLLKYAEEEPPRVRAVLGAIAEHLGVCGEQTAVLKKTLNRTTKYNIGIAPKTLPTAHSWNVY